MASEKQIAANRRNARQSTGPKTDEGKARVRLNAVKHGLTATTVVLPGEDPAELEARVDAWKDDLRPGGAVEHYLVERAAQAAWQLDRADRTLAARVSERMLRRPIDRDAREADEVAVLGRALFFDPLGPIGLYPNVREPGPLRRLSWTAEAHDPIDPARIVRRLEASAAGCQWLLDCWGELRSILDDGRPWQAPDRLRAVRLLGKQPMDAMDDERVLSVYLGCRAMDPRGPSAFADLATEMHAEEVKLFAGRAEGRGVAARTPADPSAGRAVLLGLIDRSVARLEAMRDVRLDQEAEAGPRRLEAMAFDDSEDGERLRRYQQARERALFRTIGALARVRKELARDHGDEPARIVDEAPGAVVGLVDDGGETKPFAEPATPAHTGPPTTDSPGSPPRAGSSSDRIPAEGGTPAARPVEPRLPPGSDLHVVDETNPFPPRPLGHQGVACPRPRGHGAEAPAHAHEDVGMPPNQRHVLQ